jgi:hypothetical protein
MLFPYYLPPEGKELLILISKAKFKVQENISWCSNPGYAGALITENKIFFMCTKNIMKEPNPNKFLIETFYHEAAHVVQACKGNSPIGIPLSQMPLPQSKMINIDRSILLTKKYSTRGLEHEAYWLEDKPDEIVSYFKKFCF